MARIIPRNKEREFKLTELFFSVTDTKGIIKFGNDIFTRISGYSEEELIGEPHNIIRNPDMPRAVFKLLWDYIEAGKVIAAYVKNMAKDGSFYWVTALVMPCTGGYLSVRLKPISSLFPVVQEIYADLLAVEKDIETDASRRKEAIQAGVDRLQELLTAKGFASYDEFMWLALRTEMADRESALTSPANGARGTRPTILESPSVGRLPPERHSFEIRYDCCAKLDQDLRQMFVNLDTLVALNEQLLSKAEFVLNLGEDINLLSLNASMRSKRLGDMESSRTISAIAEKIGQQTQANTSVLMALNEGMTSLIAPLGQLLFNIAASKLQVEMATHFIGGLLTGKKGENAEPMSGECDPSFSAYVDLLIQTSTECIADILPALERLYVDLNRIRLQISQLQIFVRNLQFIHFLGQVEAARTAEGIEFMPVFEEVMEQAQKADKEFKEFASVIASNMSMMEAMRKIEHQISSNIKILTRELSREETMA